MEELGEIKAESSRSRGQAEPRRKSRSRSRSRSPRREEIRDRRSGDNYRDSRRDYDNRREESYKESRDYDRIDYDRRDYGRRDHNKRDYNKRDYDRRDYDSRDRRDRDYDRKDYYRRDDRDRSDYNRDRKPFNNRERRDERALVKFRQGEGIESSNVDPDPPLPDEEQPEAGELPPVEEARPKPAPSNKIKFKGDTKKPSSSSADAEPTEEQKKQQSAIASAGMIRVIANDRLGRKIRVMCSPLDTIGDLKKLIAAQTGTKAEKIGLKKWYTIFKDHITLRDYEVGDGVSLEMY